METWVRGRRVSGPYEAPQRCIWPRLKRLTARVGERYAVFMALVVGRQWRRPRWVTAQEPDGKGCGEGLNVVEEEGGVDYVEGAGIVPVGERGIGGGRRGGGEGTGVVEESEGDCRSE